MSKHDWWHYLAPGMLGRTVSYVDVHQAMMRMILDKKSTNEDSPHAQMIDFRGNVGDFKELSKKVEAFYKKNSKTVEKFGNGKLLASLVFESSEFSDTAATVFELMMDDTNGMSWADAEMFLSLTTANSNRCYLSIVTTNNEIAKDFVAEFKDALERREEKGSVYMLVSGPGGLDFSIVGQGGMALVEENYTDEVLSSFKRIVSEITAKNPKGRLTVIEGPAGTGKTHLIKGILDSTTKAVFVIVPSHALAHFTDPNALAALTQFRSEHEGRPIVFVIEDADQVLAPRTGGSMSDISAVLNLSDGIIGSVLDIRIVATTNATRVEMDDAIKRPGRLSSMVHVGALSPEKANALLEKLTKKKMQVFNNDATLAEVYQKAYDEGWKEAGNKKTNKKFGF